MTPHLFLGISGLASLFIGMLGIFEPEFQPDFWFDAAENIVHTGYGLIALWMMHLDERPQRLFVLVSSVAALLVAIGGLLVTDQPAPNFAITNLEHPIDNALHITFAIGGLAATLPRIIRMRR